MPGICLESFYICKICEIFTSLIFTSLIHDTFQICHIAGLASPEVWVKLHHHIQDRIWPKVDQILYFGRAGDQLQTPLICELETCRDALYSMPISSQEIQYVFGVLQTV